MEICDPCTVFPLDGPSTKFPLLTIDQRTLITFGLTMKPWQKKVAETVMSNETSTILLVRPTGNGKSLVRDAVAVQLRGVTLTVVPLLTLGSDQTEKIKRRISGTRVKNVFVYHLDAMRDTESLTKLLQSLSNLPQNTPANILLFASPQILVDHKEVEDAIKHL